MPAHDDDATLGEGEGTRAPTARIIESLSFHNLPLKGLPGHVSIERRTDE